MLLPSSLAAAVLFWLAAGPRDAGCAALTTRSIETRALPKVTDAYLRDVTVGTRNESLLTYWSTNVPDATAQMAIVMIHGRYRDPDNYFGIGNTVLKAALKGGVSGAVKNTVIIAPAFFNIKSDEGNYSSYQIAFGTGAKGADKNPWIEGQRATFPAGTNVSSYSAVNSLLTQLSDKKKFPALTRIALVGHGGGGQLSTRYAALAPIPSKTDTGTSTRIIVGDPSTNLYFTSDRPMFNKTADCINCTKELCPTYNNYKFGVVGIKDQVPILANDTRTAREYFARFVKRDVVLMVGLEDTASEGDQDCEAQIMGGVARRDRNLMYWRYINGLARTSTVIPKSYPGNFSSLPNWSTDVGSKINTQLVPVSGAEHNAEDVFKSATGQKALFTWS